ncbi:MAG: hypothetical protein ACRC5T_04205 [Cetobacterium sp.]
MSKDITESKIHLKRDDITKSRTYKNDDINLTGLKVGDAFNTLTSITAASSWDVRETPYGASVHLSRDHLFYKLDTCEKEKMNNLIKTPNLNVKLNPSPSELYLESIQFLVDNDLIETLDTSMEMVNVNTSKNVRFDNTSTMIGLGTANGIMPITRHEQPLDKIIIKNNISSVEFPGDKDKSELYDLITRTGRRKFSENHFAISGFNLISSDISVNEEVANTFGYNYKTWVVMLNMQTISTLISLVPSNKAKDLSIKLATTPPYYTDAEDNVLNISRNREFLSNLLLKEMEEAYFGKIFIKFNPNIEMGDTITLINEVDSTSGVFKIDTFEHSFNKDGMYTMVSIKANVRHVDPNLDYYSQTIGLKLLEDLKEITKEKRDSVVFNNIYALALKCLVQNYKYASFYSKEQKAFFSSDYTSSGESGTEQDYDQYRFGIVNLPVRFSTMVSKGSEKIPTNFINAFYKGDPTCSNFLREVTLAIANNLKMMTRSVTTWGVGMATFIGDFVLSMATFGLHELFKPWWGTTRKNAEQVYDNESLTGRQAEILVAGEQYFSTEYKIGKPQDLVIGFFNVMAQRPSNLFPEVNDDTAEANVNSKADKDVKNTRSRVTNKANINNKLISETFDIMMGVEYYNGFKMPNINYGLDDFIKDCGTAKIGGTPSNNNKFEIFKNYYGSEYGIIWSDSVKFPKLKDEKYGKGLTMNNNISLDNDKRKAIHCRIDVTEYGLDDIKFINVISFHNLFGQGVDVITRIKYVKNVIKQAEALRVDGEEVVIMADFNLEIYNVEDGIDKSGKNSGATGTNAYWIIEKDVPYKNFIRQNTTLSKSIGGDSFKFVNKYDNVLVGDKLHKFTKSGKIKVGVYIYQYDKRAQISDHLPVYFHIKKEG